MPFKNHVHFFYRHSRFYFRNFIFFFAKTIEGIIVAATAPCDMFLIKSRRFDGILFILVMLT